MNILFIHQNFPGQYKHLAPRLAAAGHRVVALAVTRADEVSYGRQPPAGATYRQRYLQELEGRLDLSRIHFVGKVPYPVFLGILQVSSVHVYLTYPFVLSWSLLEAMSAGALVIGSRTPPVQEVIRHGHNGLLVDFFQPQELADAVVEALTTPERLAPLRERARRTIVERYDLQRVCLPQHQRLIETLAAGRTPPPARRSPKRPTPRSPRP